MKTLREKLIHRLTRVKQGQSVGVATTTILSLIQQEVSECIGEDEKVGEPHMKYFPVGGQYVSYDKEKTRNKLRSDIKEKLKERGLVK